MTPVKSNSYSRWLLGCTALAFASASGVGKAEEPARARGTPIIFSTPSKSDTVSSNLNELRTPAAPFRDLESELKKPFEALSPDASNKPRRPIRQVPPQPELNKKQMKQRLHDRAEEAFLSLEPDDPTLDNDLSKLSPAELDRYSNKSKNSMDRDYDRLDRSRTALTNRASGDLFGEKKDKEGRDEISPNKKPENGRDDRSETARNLRPNPNLTPAGDRFISDRNKPGGLNNSWENNADDAFNYNKAKRDSRREEFKRLLDGPGGNPQGKAALSSAYDLPTAQPASRSASTPSWSAPKPETKAASAKAFTKSAGLVGSPGTPQGLPEHDPTSSLTTSAPPPVQPKPATTTFSVPKRRF
jgi:hypothetical protein